MTEMNLPALEKRVEDTVVRGAMNGLAKVMQALSGNASAASTAEPVSAKLKRARRAAPRKAAPVKRAAPSTKAKGAKRSPEAMAETMERLDNYVSDYPGQGTEEIGKALSLSTKEIARPMKKLIDDGKIKTTGQKRATRYYPA